VPLAIGSISGRVKKVMKGPRETDTPQVETDSSLTLRRGCA